MNDQELLEMAAKAVGIFGVYSERSESIVNEDGYWMPLKDDGDALRLAVELGICIVFMEESDSVGAEHSRHGVIIIEAMDEYGTRRAIVRAAADIGKMMP